MENKELCKNLRREFGKNGWALLVYYGIMNVMVSMVMVADMLFAVVNAMLSGQSGEQLAGTIENSILESAMSNGWGYLIACLFGAWLLLLWKKKDFCRHTIWKTGRPMKVGAFFASVCVFISGQALFQLVAPVIEWLLNLVGISAMDAIESATMSADSFSMFLYLGLFAPVFEELLFRGLILRTMEPFGKKIAILTSAFLFGMFHGNIIQIPYAFAVGLVLGYVAVEYSIGWAMVLHMINNLVLADTLPRLLQGLPDYLSVAVFDIIIWGCTVAALIIGAVNWRRALAYLRAERMRPEYLKSFFTSPGILVFTILMILIAVLPLLMQLL